MPQQWIQLSLLHLTDGLLLQFVSFFSFFPFFWQWAVERLIALLLLSPPQSICYAARPPARLPDCVGGKKGLTLVNPSKQQKGAQVREAKKGKEETREQGFTINKQIDTDWSAVLLLHPLPFHP